MIFTMLLPLLLSLHLVVVDCLADHAADFDVNVAITPCERLPCNVTLTCSFNLTASQFHRIEITQFRKERLYYAGKNVVTSAAENVQSWPLQLSDDGSGLYSSQSITFLVPPSCQNHRYDCNVHRRLPERVVPRNVHVNLSLGDPSVTLKFASNDMDMLEYDGTEINKRLVATYANVRDRPSHRAFEKVLNANLEVVDKGNDTKDGDCMWSGFEESFITFYQPGDYVLRYNITVRGSVYSVVKQVNVVDIRGGRITLGLIVLMIGAFIAICVIGCAFLYPRPFLQFRNTMCSFCLQDIVVRDAEVPGGSEETHNEAMRRYGVIIRPLKCGRQASEHCCRTSSDDLDEVDGGINQMPQVFYGEEHVAIQSHVAIQNTHGNYVSLIGKPEKIEACLAFLQKRAQKKQGRDRSGSRNDSQVK